MYWLDTTLLIILSLGGIMGARTGLWWQLARFLSVGVSLVAAIVFHEPAALALRDLFFQGADVRLIQFTAYLVVFLGVFLTLLYVAQLIYEAIQAAQLDPLDRLLGAALGVAKAGLVLAALSLGLANCQHPTAKEWCANSQIAPFLADGMEMVLLNIPNNLKDRLEEGLLHIHDLAQTW